MSAMPLMIRRPTIASRLAAWFLLISIIPCGVLTWMMFSISSFQMDQTSRNKYFLIAESKTAQVEAMAQEKVHSLFALRSVPPLVDTTLNLTAALSTNSAGPGRRGPSSPQSLRRFLSPTMTAFRYRDFYLFSPAGEILFHLNDPKSAGKFISRGPLRDTELDNVFNRAKTLVQAEISDFQSYPGLDQPAAFIAGPVLSNMTVIGVMAFRLENEEIDSIFGNYLGLGETGEIMVGSKAGDQIMLVAPLRHDDHGAFRNLPLQAGAGDPLKKAVRGDHGYGYFTDYRGTNCIGFWTYLPSFGWGMVVKQDVSEALALVVIESRAALFLLSLFIVPIIVASWLEKWRT